MQHIIIPESAEKVRVLALGLPSHHGLESPEEVAAFWLTRKEKEKLPIFDLRKTLLETKDPILQVIGESIPHATLLYEVLGSIRELHTDKIYICKP